MIKQLWPMSLICGAVLLAIFPPLAGGQLQPPGSQLGGYSPTRSGRPSPSAAINPREYTYNKYFYNSPAVSSYSNLGRRSGGYVNNYYAYVKPQQNRRVEQALPEVNPNKAHMWQTQIQGVQRSLGAGSNRPPAAARTASPYHNRFYGGRAALGLQN